jgi:hypothetical protein
MGDALEVSGRLRYHSPSPLTEGGWGDGEFPLFGEKNPLHPALLHEGGGESGKPSRIEGRGELFERSKAFTIEPISSRRLR